MKKISILILLLASCLSSYADDGSLKTFGFISQSLVKTSDGLKLSGNSDKKFGSLSRTEVGGSLSYQINENIDMRGMASIIKDGNVDSDLRINYLLVDIHTEDGLLGTRIGRYSYEYGFYNAARNNPQYRDMELPPQGMYRDGFRYMTRSGDGIQLYSKIHMTDNYSIEVDAGHGKPILFPQKDIVQTFTMNKDAGTFTNDSTVTSFNVTLDDRQNSWSLKYGYLLMDYKFSTPYIDNGLAFPMKAKNQYLGLRKYFDFGDLTLEIMQTKMGETKWDSLFPLTGYVWGGVEGRSITYKHYVTEHVSAIIGYDHWYVNKADKNGEKFESATYGTSPSGAMYHRSMNYGLIYKECNYSIKGEFHKVMGTNTIRSVGNDIGSQSQPEKYNIFILSVTYLFR